MDRIVSEKEIAELLTVDIDDSDSDDDNILVAEIPSSDESEDK